jgi:hypothetical protein
MPESMKKLLVCQYDGSESEWQSRIYKKRIVEPGKHQEKSFKSILKKGLPQTFIANLCMKKWVSEWEKPKKAFSTTTGFFCL